MATKQSTSLVLVTKQNGFAIIPLGSPLTRLNYFDGKFLRANDLKAEQDYLRQLVQQSNQAGGSGVVHGFDLTLDGNDVLNVGSGLAIDGEGRTLLMPQPAHIGVQELIDKSRDLEKLLSTSKASQADNFEDCELHGSSQEVNLQEPASLYLIVISSAEALCGETDVYGKLCEEACVTSTDRPFVIEGVVVRAQQLKLKSPLPTSKAVPPAQIHLRSRVAAARFADEQNEIANLISSPGLQLTTWCMGAGPVGDTDVPIGVIARAGKTTIFLDAWIARRELMETPARRYWQWRMMMRPSDVFLAHVLQFQCQLRDVARVQRTPATVEVVSASAERDLLKQTTAALTDLQKFYEETTRQFTGLHGNLPPLEGGVDRIENLNKKLQLAHETLAAQPENQWLINRGIVELPSAGYLPVVPGMALTINQQVRRMMGEGVDLRFCVVRPDYVAHALEAAQHMDRISLIDGLENPQRKPEVDILVPDGEIIEEVPVRPGAFEANLKLLPELARDLIQMGGKGRMNFVRAFDFTFTFTGVARQETTASGGLAFYSALLFDDSTLREFLGEAFTTEVSEPKNTVPSAQTTDTVDTANVTTRPLFSQLKDTARQKFGSQLKATNPVVAAGESIGSSTSTFGPSVAAPREPQVLAGVWMSFTFDRDPRNAQPNDTLFVSGRVVIGAQVPRMEKGAYLDIHLNVEPFLVTEASIAIGEGVIVGEASVRGTLMTRLGDEKENDTRTSRTRISIKWKRLSSGTGLEIEIPDPHSDNPFVLNGSWGGRPGTIEIGQPEYFNWQMKPNAEVLKLENERHQKALTALTAIGSALDDSLFFQISSKQLFPPPPKVTDELSIRGTKDWVLFHRRRTKRCSVAAVAPPNRRYRVYQFAATPERLKQLKMSPADVFPKQPPTIDQVVNSASYLKLFDPIGEATFEGGVATLGGDVSGLKTAWKKVTNGKIVWGAVATRGEALADGDALAQFRLTTVESTLDQVEPGARADVLPVMPPSLSSADVDGVILLVNGEVAKPGIANLTINKLAHVETDAVRATIIRYEISMTNEGPSIAQDVVMVDAVPANTSFVSATGLDGTQPWTIERPAVGGRGDVKFHLASMPVNTPHSVEIVVKPISGVQTVTNTASVTSATSRLSSILIETIVGTQTPPQPASADVSVTLTLVPTGPLQRGQIAHYLAIVRNNGRATAQNVRLAVPIPANLTFREANQNAGRSQWTLTSPPLNTLGLITFTTPSLNVDDFAGFDIAFEVNKEVTAASITCEVTVTADTEDNTKANNKATIERAVTTGRGALVILGRMKRFDHVPDTDPLSRVRVLFEDNVATGQDLGHFAEKHKGKLITSIDSGAVGEVTAGAEVRASAVREAIATTGSEIRLSQPINIATLTETDKRSLREIDDGILNGIDEVIFVSVGNEA